MEKLFYDCKSHGLYYENKNTQNPTFSLLIDTLEIQCRLDSGEIVGIQGFLPLIKADKGQIRIDSYEKEKVYIGDIDKQQYEVNMAYDLFAKIPETCKYFETALPKFDEQKGIIQIGTEAKASDRIIKISNNIYCGLDNKNTLKCVILVPDAFL